VTKLSPSGSSLVYSTYLGGSSHENGWAIAVDDSGSTYVTGATLSTDFPTLNPFQADQADWDVFVTKLSPSGTSLAYSTYLGGGRQEDAYGLAVDGSGNAYVTGKTESADFPTFNAYQASRFGAGDAFVGSGGLNVTCHHDVGTAHVIIDVNGYFE
jgi:Beta-propeller repeat